MVANSICIVGVIRLIYTIRVYEDTYDSTWVCEPIWLWTVVELHGAIMCASAPALKVFFERYLSAAVKRSVLGYRGRSQPDESELTPRNGEKGFIRVAEGSGSGSGGTIFAGDDSMLGYEATAYAQNGRVHGGDANHSILYVKTVSVDAV